MEPGTFRAGDLVAVTLPPGPSWPGILADARAASAAVLPVDSRLPVAAARALIARARPTLLLSEGGAARFDGAEGDAELGFLVATSGTSGEPRLVEHTRASADAAIAMCDAALGLDATTRWLCCLPVAHVGGLLVALRHAAIGAHVEMHPRFDVDAFAASDADAVSIVPTMLHRLVEAGAALDRFRVILVGGAGLDPELRRRAEDRGARIVQTYGMTETFGGVVHDGRILSGVRVETDAGGRLRIASPTLMRAYRGDAEATAAARDGEWFLTGDLGRVADGRVEVFGRADDAITTGGETVFPDPVEAALAAHPGVAEVAVAGIPDPEWGERVVAFVVPRDPAVPPTIDALRSLAGATLPPWAAPREVVLLGALPRTASGKVRRAALRREHRPSPEG